MELQCPKCQKEIEFAGIQQQIYHCPECACELKIHAECNKCGEQLELLQACGAANLWCNKCNELKSKSTAIYSLQES